MYRKIVAALVASTLCAPAMALEPTNLAPNSTMFYFSIPLDGATPKDRVPSYGLAMRGSRDYQVVNIDSRAMNNMIMRLEGEGFAGIEATWLVVGGVAAAAAVAVGKSGSSSVQTQQQQQQQQAAAIQQSGGTTNGATTTNGTTTAGTTGGGTTGGGATAPCTCTLW
jgi:hypothetical protein